MHTIIQRKHTKNWGCKVKYILKNTFKKIPQILRTILSCMGILMTIAECVHWMFKSEIVYEWLHTYVILILIICILIGFVVNQTKLHYEYFLGKSDVKITLDVTDVLTYHEAVVIPTNTTFDTLMEDEFISVNSVQGQFQKRYFDGNLHTLDDLIEKGLDNIEYEKIDRKRSKCKRYPIGTVSKVTLNGTHYYFVAIADINEYGKPINASFQNIQMALEGIWSQLENKGHMENLAIPLLGTGKAGIKDATREKVIKEIIFSFVASARERKITEKMIICIHPIDLEYKDLKLSELDEYLQYMCKYRYVDVCSRAEGTAM